MVIVVPGWTSGQSCCPLIAITLSLPSIARSYIPSSIYLRWTRASRVSFLKRSLIASANICSLLCQGTEADEHLWNIDLIWSCQSHWQLVSCSYCVHQDYSGEFWTLWNRGRTGHLLLLQKNGHIHDGQSLIPFSARCCGFRIGKLLTENLCK